MNNSIIADIRHQMRTFSSSIFRLEYLGLRFLLRKWRKLHNEELNVLYSSPNIFRVIKSIRMRWARHVAGMGERTVVCGVLVGNPKGRRPPGKPKRRWEDSNKMDLQEVGCGSRSGSSWLRIGTVGKPL
jgi:hypothetical protein